MAKKQRRTETRWPDDLNDCLEPTSCRLHGGVLLTTGASGRDPERSSSDLTEASPG